MKLYDRHFFHAMKLYDKFFSINENSKNFCFEISCFIQKRIFCHENTQSVTGSYHADNLNLVVSAMKVHLVVLAI